MVDKPDSFDDRFQLVIYAYLALKNEKATPGNLNVAYLFLRPRIRGDYEGRLPGEDLAACDATLDKIAQRLDELLSRERFLPNFRAAGCDYCPHKALCLKPDLYRTGGKPW
jgi:RecB family exonuclease